jgi:hypothetical protein
VRADLHRQPQLLAAFGFFFSLLARHLPVEGAEEDALRMWLYAPHGPVRDFVDAYISFECWRACDGLPVHHDFGFFFYFEHAREAALEGRLGTRAARVAHRFEVAYNALAHLRAYERALERALARVRDSELERYAWHGLQALPAAAIFHLERIPERGDEGDWGADGGWVPGGCPVDVSARVTLGGSRRKPRCVLVLNVRRSGNGERHHADTSPRPPLTGGRRHLHLLVRGVSDAGIEARGGCAQFWSADVENFGENVACDDPDDYDDDAYDYDYDDDGDDGGDTW